MVRNGLANPSLLIAVCAMLAVSACADLPSSGQGRSGRVPEDQVEAAMRSLPAQVFVQPARAVMAQATRQGNLAIAVDNWPSMISELAAGHSLVIGQDDRPAEVVVGYDLDAGVLRLAGDRMRPLAPWRGDWVERRRWAVAVLPPGDLPAVADPRRYLRAVNRLEDSGYAWEAVLAYDAGLTQWPENVDVLVGLAGSLADLGDRKGASEALATALGLARDAAQRERISRLADEISKPLPTFLRTGAEKPLSAPSQ